MGGFIRQHLRLGHGVGHGTADLACIDERVGEIFVHGSGWDDHGIPFLIKRIFFLFYVFWLSFPARKQSLMNSFFTCRLSYLSRF